MPDRGEHGLHGVAALGLVIAGAGLLGMTAGKLPGIAEQLAAPRWLMGIVGGILVACGVQADHWPATRALFRASPRWVELVAYAIGGIVIARLSDLTRTAGSVNDALWIGLVINSAGRVLFGIGTGMVIGWAAYEGSSSRRPGGRRSG